MARPLPLLSRSAKRRGDRHLGRLGLLGLSLLGGCGAPPQESTQKVPPTGQRDLPPPFEAVLPGAALGKVKSLLTGEPPNDAELKAVSADPTALRGLVDKWMLQQQFADKMLAFFRNAFQQNQVTTAAVQENMGLSFLINPAWDPVLSRNMMDSFPRTAWQIVSQGKPFSQALTTTSYMVTPPLLAYLLYADQVQVSDKGTGYSWMQKRAGFKFTLTHEGSPIPVEQSVTPGNANYMIFYDPQAPQTADCKPGEYPRVSGNPQILLEHLYGRLQAACSKNVGSYAPAFTPADFTAWRMVTFNPTKAMAETAPDFYDINQMRSATSVSVRVPHQGFFSTPAFIGNWGTNTSNQDRVTMNQTLIVALGKSFDGSTSVVPVSETGLDSEHADPTTECYTCHRTLDPMRQFFRQAFTLFYSQQFDPAQTAVNGVFAFDGVTKQGTGLGDLAATLASHPRFGQAWAQKLCYYANSAACSEDDPEFLRVVGVFQQSGFNFKALVRELFTSPLVTALKDTKTFEDQGLTISIARRNHLCAALSNRLGLADVCGLETPQRSAAQSKIGGLAVIVPTDGYSRGSEVSVTATDPSLFFRATTENVCRAVADQVVDVPPAVSPTSRYSSKVPQQAIADFVATVMGLPPSDQRAAPAQQVLAGHYAGLTSAMQPKGQQQVAPTDALKSTFVLACMSPPSVIIGL